MKIKILTMAFLLNAFVARSQDQDSLLKIRRASMFPIETTSGIFYDIVTINNENNIKFPATIFKYHPALNEMFSGELKDSLNLEVRKRASMINSDILNNKDFFYVWRPILDWARHIDPHFRVAPMIDAHSRKEAYKIYKQVFEKQKRIPATLCNINDSLIVVNSKDPNIKSGDLIRSINGVTTDELLKYCYDDRYITVFNLMLMYDYMVLSDNFRLKVVRNNKQLTVTTTGIKPSEIEKADVCHTAMYNEYGCGYIQISEFPKNSTKLIKAIYNAIIEFKEAGINSVIIDVRDNPGGYGSNFDKLISIFSSKDKLPYTQNQKLRVSNFTLDYEFAQQELMFQNIDFPQGNFIKEIPLDKKMYIEDVNYYVLASRGTNSTAATFVNILNYNDIATICGEPLMNNAIRFGETIEDFAAVFQGSLLSPSGVSTVEYFEYTKAVDGILIPDIFIPYVASEYMTGKDAVLEKLLGIIKNR